MTKSEARAIAGRYLASLQEDSSVELAINDEITEAHEAGYVFFYNSADYWRTRDMMTGLAGNGPILVRPDGEVVTLPTNQSVEASLHAV